MMPEIQRSAGTIEYGVPTWVSASLIGSVGLILAALGGVGFVNSGEATSSLVMALGFLLALIAYGMVLYLTRAGRVVR
jgi:hypothetical protein